MTEQLYGDADAYAEVFGDADTADEHDFYRKILGTPAPRRIIDLGCGCSSLAADLATELAVPLDCEMALLRAIRPTTPSHTPVTAPTRADINCLPFADGVFDAIVSHLFGTAYAIGTLWQHPQIDNAIIDFFRELRRLLTTGGAIALDIPINDIPKNLAGLAETMPLTADQRKTYAFYYLDTLRQCDAGVILDTMIRIETDNGSITHDIAAPLMVFTPDGIRKTLRDAGFINIAFCPMGDHIPRQNPPQNSLRAVLLAKR